MGAVGRERLAWGGGGLILYGLGQWSTAAAFVFAGLCCWGLLYWMIRGQPGAEQ